MGAVAAYIPLLTLLQLLDTLKLRYKYKFNFIDPKQIDSLEEKVLYLVEFLESLPPRPDDPQIEPFVVQICDSVVSACQVLDFHVVDQIRRVGKAFQEGVIKVIGDLESISCKIGSLDTEVFFLALYLKSAPQRPDDPQIEPFILSICNSVVKTCQDLDFKVVEEYEGGKLLSAFREKVIRDLESISCKIHSLEEKVLDLVEFLESFPPRLDDPLIEPFILEIGDSVVKTCKDLDFKVAEQIRRFRDAEEDEGGKLLSAFREGVIKVIGDLESIRCKVTGFNLESATLNTVSELPLISTDPSSNSTIKSGDPKVIEFEHHVSFLKDEFIFSHVKTREVIPIVGMGGIGKTTLARFVYEDPSIRRRFDKRYWVTISQEYDLLRILQGILDDKACDSIRDLGTSLSQSLKGFRYLIVLDDMWDLGAWEDLRQYFPEDNQGSRIIVTSRDKNLADGLRSSKTCDVGFLSEEKSWELFCDRVFGGMCRPSEQLKTIGRQILKNCRGLPLGIITIAGLLSKSNKTCEYWSSVSKDVAALVNLEDNEHCRKVLSLSYDCLPLHLKSLFLYIGEGSIKKTVGLRWKN